MDKNKSVSPLQLEVPARGCIENQARQPNTCPDFDPNAALARELRGQHMRVDMTKSFTNWPSGLRHPLYETLVHEVDRVISIGISDPKRCDKFKKCDFALFSSLWWPNATWEDLYTAMLFTVCLFIWDDIIDTNEHALASDFEEASTWRKDSLAYFKYHLQLCPQDQAEPYCPDSICILFKAFGERFCRSFGHAHRLRMFTKIEQFVQHNEMEQAERLNGQMPNYEHYLHVRFGVTGVRMFSLLLEIANQSALPSWVMDSEEMNSAIDECNFIIIVVNDILSLKKEIATDCVFNVVPVLYKSGKSLDQALSYLMDEMHASRDRLDGIAAKLDSMTKHDPGLNKHVLDFLNGLRVMDTGTLIYSIESLRYGIKQYEKKDGSLDIIL